MLTIKRNLVKSILWISTCIVVVILVTSCEKVVDIELDNVSDQLVIEGVITDQLSVQTIKLSRSVAFTESNVFPAVQGAEVRVSDNSGQIWIFNESTPGNYSTTLKGVPGKTYTMTVKVSGVTYTASSTMPSPVKLDSIDTREFTFGGNVSKQAQAHYKDPAGQSNYYRFVLKVNGRQSLFTYTENDRFTDGNEVRTVLFREEEDDDKIKTGDSVEVEMQCIDANVFTYWFTLTQQTQNGPGGGTTPGNPPSNIRNGALGYFSAQTRELKEMKVK